MSVRYKIEFFTLFSLYIPLFALTVIITNYAFTQIPESYGETLYDIANDTISNQVSHITNQVPHVIVRDGPSAIDVDNTAKKVYVVNQFNNTVSVIDENNDKNIANITVGEGPSDIVVDSSTKKVYVANRESNTISVINENNYKNIDTILVGRGPSSIAIDPFTKKVYVVNQFNNTVSVINENNYKNIDTILVGRGPSDIAIDPFTKKVYVVNQFNNTVSVIDENNDKNIANITVGEGPSDIVVDSSTKKVYVANRESNTVSVINENNYKNIDTILVGRGPSSIAIDPFTKKVYVANRESNTVSVINENNYKNIANITVREGPSSIAIDYSNRVVFVANRESNTVSVINENNYKNIDTILVGRGPSAIVVDHSTKKVYVANRLNDSVSVFKVANEVLAGILFDVQPPNSGNIVCNNLPFQMPLNLFGYVFFGDNCIAKPNKGYEFQSWVLNPNGNHTQTIKVSNLAPTNIYDYMSGVLNSIENFFVIKDDINSIVSYLGITPYFDHISKSLNLTSPEDDAIIPINQLGNYTANFKSLPSAVPPEYIATLFSFMLTTLFGTLLIPSVIGWSKSKGKEKKLDHHYKKLNSLHIDGKLDSTDISKLDILRNNITDDYAMGKINKEQFDKLINETEINYIQIYKNELNSLISLSENDKEQKLKGIENHVKDTYSKEKIRIEQFKNLIKELSIQWGKIYKKRIDHLNGLDIAEKEKQINLVRYEIEEAYSAEIINDLQYNLLQKRLENLK